MLTTNMFVGLQQPLPETAVQSDVQCASSADRLTRHSLDIGWTDWQLTFPDGTGCGTGHALDVGLDNPLDMSLDVPLDVVHCLHSLQALYDKHI